jgi:DNA-binding SARP family transcriptional activator
MRDTPISKDISKIKIPDISRTVARKRLYQRIDKNKHKNLILITGQAAQGKSTLAASYLHESGLPFAWINVSSDDSNPANLFHSLIFSLENPFPGIDFSPLKNYPALSVGPRDEGGLYRDWVRALLEFVPFPFHIVFDGLDRLAPNAPSNLFLRICFQEVNPDITLWFISRTGEPFDKGALKLDPKGLVIENSELSFTKNETREYFLKFNRINLSRDHLSRIHQNTEGWVGGLILLSEAIDRLPEHEREDRLFSEISAQFQTQAFHYFGGEILNALPRSTQRFLIVSSIFETMVPELIEDFFKDGNCLEILSKLEQRNLFIHSIYDERQGWLFRYHQLFRDYLQSRFKSDLSANERKSIRYRAGLVCESYGAMESAARFYIRCHRHQNAENVIENIGMNLIQMGRIADLSTLIRALPEQRIKSNPWLLLYLSATRRFTGADENTSSLISALQLFKRKEDLRGHLLSLAFLIEASTYRGRDIVPLGILLEEGEMILRTSPAKKYPWESATLWYQVGFNTALRAGDQRKGYQASHNAYLLARSIGSRPLQIAALVSEMLPLSLVGEFAKAHKMARKANSILKKEPYTELHAVYLLNYSQVCTVQGELSRARDFAYEAKEIVETHGLLYLYPVALLSELMLRPQMEDFTGGEETGHQLLQFASDFGIVFLSSVASMFMGLGYYLKLEYKTAERYFADSCRIASADDSYSETHLGWNKILMGLVLFHQERIGQAEVLLKEALDHFTEIASTLTMVVVHWSLAFIKHAQKMHSEAVTHLKMGIEIARTNDFFYFIFLNQEDYLNVCALCIEYSLEESEGYVSKLISLRLAGIKIDKFWKITGQFQSPKNRVRQNIIRNVHRFGLPIVRVEMLNGFNVYRGDARISDGEWGGSLPQMLLKTIITRGGKKIPKEIIMEELWPGATKSSSETNLKVNLHRLRKILEPSMKKEIGSSYVQLKDNLISLDEELFDIDIVKFRNLITEADSYRKEGNTKVAIRCYTKASEIYIRDYLVEDLYHAPFDFEREKLRQKYAYCLFQLGGLYEDQGSLKKAELVYKKLIDFEPLSEEAHQKLILNYLGRGRNRAAIQLYLQYEEKLKSELDADPSDVIRSIYMNIADQN